MDEARKIILVEVTQIPQSNYCMLAYKVCM